MLQMYKKNKNWIYLWPQYVIGQAIIFLSCGFFFFYLSSIFFFPRLISAVEIGCLPYFDTWCGFSANLECRSEMCYTRLAGNAGPKKIAENSPSGHHCTTLSCYIFATKACIDNLKKMETAMSPPHVVTIW